MIIIPNTAHVAFEKRIYNIGSWEEALLPWEHYDEPLYSSYSNRKCSFWLGHSPDNKEWALAAIPRIEKEADGSFFTHAFCTFCSAILVNPEDIQKDVIFRILFLVNDEIGKNKEISPKKISEIYRTVPFSEYFPARTYLPELPKEWMHLPVELCVNFDLSENSCVLPSTFREYSRNNLKEALKVLYGPRHDGLLICYMLAVRKVIPFLSWGVDWPLSRRGKEPPFRREKVQGILPYEYHADLTILSIYQWLPGRNLLCTPPYFGQPSIRLRVGGRCQEEAISNWHQCAKLLRKMRPERNRS